MERQREREITRDTAARQTTPVVSPTLHPVFIVELEFGLIRAHRRPQVFIFCFGKVGTRNVVLREDGTDNDMFSISFCAWLGVEFMSFAFIGKNDV